MRILLDEDLPRRLAAMLVGHEVSTVDVSGKTVGMQFKLSDHAEMRIRQRKIKLEWIEAAVENPDKIENDADDHTLVHALRQSRREVPEDCM
jgi:hypothetical protein